MLRITFIPDSLQSNRDLKKRDLKKLKKLTGIMWFRTESVTHSCQCEIEDGLCGFTISVGEVELPIQLKSGVISQAANDLLHTYWCAMYGREAYIWTQG
jgi:hypothetical protein